MAIAITGNKIVDAQARQGAAQVRREAARQKAVAKMSGKKSGSVKSKPRCGKFRGAGKAGRAACKRAGKGIAAKFIGKGKNASGAVNYGLKEGGKLLCSNCGFEAQTISLGLSMKMRSDIKDQILHFSFSIPPVAGRLKEDEWRRMGFPHFNGHFHKA